MSLNNPQTARSPVSESASESRSFFLREFLRTAIMQVPERPEWSENTFLLKLPQRAQIQTARTSIPPVIIPSKRFAQQIRPITRPVHSPQHSVLGKSSLFQKPAAKPSPPAIGKTPPAQAAHDNALLPKSGGKIVQFLRDPAIIGIECAGPGKSLIINRTGTVMSLPVQLTAEEIRAILEEVSEETRIPLINGVFKALYKSLMVTAVISDFVSTRFIIEKRPVYLPTAIPIRY